LRRRRGGHRRRHPDLGAPGSAAELIAAAGDLFGALDILVNSAASFQRRPFQDISAADWDHVMAVNLRAPFQLIQHAARLMGPRRADGEPPGAVVNIADLSGEKPWRGYVHHGVSKAALLHLTRGAALALGPDVRVNAVVPGAILPPPGLEATDDAWRRRGERLPVGRLGAASDVGRAVRFLVEEDFITGEVLHVDGGEGLLSGRP
ncbi:MAG: SDR family oxidoreductase, partial [Anaerolineae bacterium]